MPSTNLRDYVITSTQADRANGIFPSVVVDGDFFCVRSTIQIAAGVVGVEEYNCDVLIECVFDDNDVIKRRSGEGGRRNYSRVTFKPYEPNGVQAIDYRIIVALGVGEFYSEREQEPIPKQLTTFKQAVTTGAAQSLTISGNLGSKAKEIRLCIPSTEAGGLFFGPTAADAAANGAWLEKGVTEWITYTGPLFLYNPIATTVNITVAILNRKDI